MGGEGRDRVGWRRGEEAQKKRRVTDAIYMENKGDAGGKRKTDVDKRVRVDQGYLENTKKAERDAQSAQGLIKNCRESLSPLLRLS